MTPRDRNLAIALIGLILVGGGVFGGYTFVYSPLQEANDAMQKLQEEIDVGTPEKPALNSRVEMMRKAAKEAVILKHQSLPKDIDVAKREYKLLLARLLQQAGISTFTLPDAKTLPGRPPITPELAAKKPAYTAIQIRFDIKKVTIWQLADFLYEFYQLDLLHQITEITIDRENKATEARNGLEVHLTIEAIILDGAESKLALFPVVMDGKLTTSGEAVAAIGGGRAAVTVAAQPKLDLKVSANSSTPVLATKSRDYSFIALRDIFYGVLPVEKSTILQFARIPDIQIYRGEKIPDVKLSLTGDGSETAKISATASGSLMKEGPLTIDPKTNTIQFPEMNEDTSDFASSTITLTATPESGKEHKSTFKVSIRRPETTTVGNRDDISSAIKLIMVSGYSNGIMKAEILDSANPFIYKVTAGPDNKVEVVKWYLLKAKSREWRKEDYEHPPGVLAFSDEISSTKKAFKVIAIENDALILADIGKSDKPESKPDAQRGGRPAGGRPGSGASKAGPAEPLAGVAGNLATQVPVPVLYRWSNGKSLADMMNLGKIPTDETKKILGRVAQAVPVETPVSSVK